MDLFLALPLCAQDSKLKPGPTAGWRHGPTTTPPARCVRSVPHFPLPLSPVTASPLTHPIRVLYAFASLPCRVAHSRVHGSTCKRMQKHNRSHEKRKRTARNYIISPRPVRPHSTRPHSSGSWRSRGTRRRCSWWERRGRGEAHAAAALWSPCRWGSAPGFTPWSWSCSRRIGMRCSYTWKLQPRDNNCTQIWSSVFMINGSDRMLQ